MKPAPTSQRVARTVEVTGVVQGVGFRPFVWRLATELGLDGSVINRAGQVEIEVAGSEEAVDRVRPSGFARTRRRALGWRMSSSGPSEQEIAAGSGFAIEESEAAASTERLFPPDIATCDDCLRELLRPDRPAVSLSVHQLHQLRAAGHDHRGPAVRPGPDQHARVPALRRPARREYRDPANRRFHAEPVACPDCGPQLSYRRPGDAAPAAHREAALQAALDDLRAGRIVAVKGLGGYHLACDATDPAAVARLRDRKHRWAKPFAVMVRDIDEARARPGCPREEEALLTSPARPIVLVERRGTGPPRAENRRSPTAW